MVALAEKLRLSDDQFAIYFAGGGSLEASDLGKFLQRSSTVARHRGAILLVDDIRPGSRAIILRAIGSAIRKEFKDTPVKTTAAAGALTALVAGAIASAMSSATPSPVAKAAAEIVVEQRFERIEVVTVNKSTVVMDQERAGSIVRYKPRTSKIHEVDLDNAQLEAREGSLTGSFVDVEGQPYFRPDGHNFLVPAVSVGMEEIPPPGHYRIMGDLVIRRGVPDVLYVKSIRELRF